MNRLTKDLHTPHDDTGYSDIVGNAVDRENIVLTKLKHYEDIEEDLGIDLIIVFNIYNQLCKQRYVYKKFTDTREIVKVDLDEGYFVIDFKGKQIERIYCGEPSNWYEFKNYTKTWALDKQTLEK